MLAKSPVALKTASHARCNLANSLFSDEDEDEGDEESIEAEVAPFETILLGHIVRFDRDRRHPEDLAAEAVDVLQRIIHGADSLQDADRKAIEDLLGSL